MFYFLSDIFYVLKKISLMSIMSAQDVLEVYIRVRISHWQFAISKAFWQFANELLHFF